MSNFEKKLSQLQNDYNSKRNSNFDSSEFLTLVICFPSVLVAVADNNFDEYEEEWVISLAVDIFESVLGRTPTEDEIASFEMKFFTEMVHLAQNNVEWKEPFLNILPLFSEKELKSVHDTIKKMLVIIAEASEGISEVEQEQIDYINENYLNKG